MVKPLLGLSFAALGCVALGQSFSEGFETGPTGWTTGVTTFGNTVGGDALTFNSGNWYAINNSTPIGTTGWYNGLPTVFAANSGAGYAAANYHNGDGTATIDNWFYAPVRTFHNGDSISFFTRVTESPSSFPDRLFLRLSTNGSSTNFTDFGTTLLAVNSGLSSTGYPATWTQYSATLAGLSATGVSGRFAFNYSVPGGGPSGSASEYIGLDDVTYTAVPEPASMTALGLGALALLRKRRKSG